MGTGKPLKADAWLAVTDGSERRRIQNRVNQRTPRLRRHEEEREAGIVRRLRGRPRLDNKTMAAHGNSTQKSTGSRQPLEIIGRTHDIAPEATDICKLAPVEFMARHSRLAAVVWSGNPTFDLLLSLTQLNSWRAMMQNMNALGLTMETVKQESAVSRFNLHDAAAIDGPLPPALRPTSLQRALKHHPWIDPFPFPDFRDILLLREGEYDEEALCNDLCGSSTEQSSKCQVGMITWGEPWDPSSWEMTEEFARKWFWMFSTCNDLLAATNHWRVQRGEVELFGWLSGIPYIKEGLS